MLKMIILASTCTSSFLWRFSWALLLLPVVQRLIFWQWICTTFFCFQKFFDKHDKDKDGLIDFAEFVKYVTDHERKLRLYFKKIDTNDDGEYQLLRRIDNHEILMTSVILPAVRHSGISYTAQWSTITIEIFQFK